MIHPDTIEIDLDQLSRDQLLQITNAATSDHQKVSALMIQFANDLDAIAASLRRDVADCKSRKKTDLVIAKFQGELSSRAEKFESEFIKLTFKLSQMLKDIISNSVRP